MLLRTGAGGGGRTRTRGEPNGILSPARLPVSPLRHVLRIYCETSSCADCPVEPSDATSSFCDAIVTFFDFSARSRASTRSRRGLGEGVVGGAEHGDEQLDLAHLAGLG